MISFIAKASSVHRQNIKVLDGISVQWSFSSKTITSHDCAIFYQVFQIKLKLAEWLMVETRQLYLPG
jgi:hypothetical protein